MSEENKVILLKRFKSLLWRLGAMIGVALVAFVLNNINLVSLPDWIIVVVGLVGGEITKYLNTYLLSTETV